MCRCDLKTKTEGQHYLVPNIFISSHFKSFVKRLKQIFVFDKCWAMWSVVVFIQYIIYGENAKWQFGVHIKIIQKEEEEEDRSKWRNKSMWKRTWRPQVLWGPKREDTWPTWGLLKYNVTNVSWHVFFFQIKKTTNQFHNIFFFLSDHYYSPYVGSL